MKVRSGSTEGDPLTRVVGWSGEGLRLVEWLEVRCPNCHKLLARILWFGCILEVKCDRFKMLVTWPSLTAEIKSSEENHEQRELADHPI